MRNIKTAALVLMALMMISIVPSAFADVFGTNIGIGMSTEPFQPSIWRCGAWIMTDDPTETGRISNSGENLVERTSNYIFNGEKLKVDVLILDKNGLEKAGDVFVTVNGNIEANCQRTKQLNKNDPIKAECNAKLGEETFTKAPDDDVMAYYTCTLTAEPTSSMHGNLPVVAKITDLSNKSATTNEVLTYYFNPAVSLSVSGPIDFGQVRPGTQATSKTVVLSQNSEGGVKLDMFIAGKDFYDTTSSGAMCPTSNVLSLSRLSYYATNGAYSTSEDPRKIDASGYVGIKYCVGSECSFNPTSYYNSREIMQVQPVAPYYAANILNSGSGMSMTFRVDLPMPCNGNFNSGTISIVGEAV